MVSRETRVIGAAAGVVPAAVSSRGELAKLPAMGPQTRDFIDAAPAALERLWRALSSGEREAVSDASSELRGRTAALFDGPEGASLPAGARPHLRALSVDSARIETRGDAPFVYLGRLRADVERARLGLKALPPERQLSVAVGLASNFLQLGLRNGSSDAGFVFYLSAAAGVLEHVQQLLLDPARADLQQKLGEARIKLDGAATRSTGAKQTPLGPLRELQVYLSSLLPRNGDVLESVSSSAPAFLPGVRSSGMLREPMAAVPKDLDPALREERARIAEQKRAAARERSGKKSVAQEARLLVKELATLEHTPGVRRIRTHLREQGRSANLLQAAGNALSNLFDGPSHAVTLEFYEGPGFKQARDWLKRAYMYYGYPDATLLLTKNGFRVEVQSNTGQRRSNRFADPVLLRPLVQRYGSAEEVLRRIERFLEEEYAIRFEGAKKGDCLRTLSDLEEL